MIFRKSKKTVKKGMSGVDKLVTGLIVGGAAASIYGASRTPQGRKILGEIGMQLSGGFRFGFKTFGNVALRFLSFLKKK